MLDLQTIKVLELIASNEMQGKDSKKSASLMAALDFTNPDCVARWSCQFCPAALAQSPETNTATCVGEIKILRPPLFG